ncbi:MAG: LLM class flavin-dependent oxidoreductase [Acidimicrobiales bacterium]
MSVGALLVPGLPGGPSFGAGDLVRLGVRAEALGLDRVGVSDHLLHRAGAHDPVAVLGALAAATERVRIESAVLQLPLRHPVQVAQSFTTLDHLSGGRVELGVGIGGEDPDEHRAVGLDPRRRAQRADEALSLLPALWSGEPVTFSGRQFALDAVTLAPRPVQRPHPPIVVGGRASAALDRAARLAQRWDGIFLDPTQYARRAAELDERAGWLGRTVGKGLVAWICTGASVTASAAMLADVLPSFYGVGWERLARFALWGPPARCAGRLAELREAGATDFLLIPVGEPDRQLEALAETAEQLGPAMVDARPAEAVAAGAAPVGAAPR